MNPSVTSKACTNCKSDFQILEPDLVFYEKFDVPKPTMCHDCRQQRRLAWRNERYMYKRKCDFSGDEIISMYPPDSPFKIYKQDIWWSDKWDATEYGREFDFDRPFFEQFRELQLEVPRVALVNKQSQNSDYTNHASKNKNCFMSGCIFGSEDCYYSDWIMDCKDSVDCSYMLEGSELCYETYYAWGSYRAFYCDFIKRCSDTWFCYDCVNAKNCFMCWNLRNKEYCIRNEQLTKDDYEREMAKLFPLTRERLDEFRAEYIKTKERGAIRPAIYSVQTENSVGDLMFQTKNAFYTFDSIEVEDCRYIYDAIEVKDSMDLYHVGWSELLYECHAVVNAYFCRFCHFCYDNSNLTYCDCVQNSKNCFGCAGLNRKEYCILNKQYSKEEYEKLVPRIVEHMKSGGEFGEFFPIEFSPFAYTQARVQEYYPLTKAEVKAKGWRWSDYEAPLPEVSGDVEMVTCEITGRPFGLIKQELDFYKKMGLPLPRRHPDQRYLDRIAQRVPRKLWKRGCTKCEEETWASFAPKDPAKVYCRECYLGEVY